MNKSMRVEEDSLGKIEVPENALWGAQTQRSILNFSIGSDLIPLDLIYALARIKQAAAKANYKLGRLDKERCHLIIKVSEEIAKGLHNDQFPLKVWQTGSGTQTNMNMNEVISNLAAQSLSLPLGRHEPLHPNDHVNCSQSTNDVFPAAIQIATIKTINDKLLPEVKLLIHAFSQKSHKWKKIIKTGRTHLQDAVPLTLGQEVSAWRDQLLVAQKRIESNLPELHSLPLGGTAVGTGLNTPPNFDHQIAEELSQRLKLPFEAAINKFAIMASHDGLVNMMSQLKLLAVSLLKISNDIRLLSSGPRTGLAELQLPENEPGSSIMPGKVNPTQCEAMSMACTQIIAMDIAVAMAGSGGHLQMNAYKPLIGFNLLKSIELLCDSCFSFRTKMVDGVEPNLNQIKEGLEKSLMLITALTPKIGYEKATKIAQLAHRKDLSLREASNELGYITEQEFNDAVNPISMVKFD